MIYLNYFLVSIYFTLPAYFANMAPVIFAKLGWFKFAARPVDGGRKLGQNYLFGQNKTWRGIIAAIILSLIVTIIQAFLYDYDFFYQISLLNYQVWFPLFGVLAGLGAILGDLIKSFFKRRFNISSGQAWPIFDQLDFIFGFILFTYFLAKPSAPIIIAVVVITLILHPLTNLISYFLKIKRVWW